MSFSLQKANFWKRISAFMFDAILAFCLMLGVGIGVSFALDYDTSFTELKTIRTEVETIYEFEKHGLSFNISEEDYKKLDATKQAIYDEANAAFLQDARTANNLRKLVVLAIINIGSSLFVSDLVIYFIIPLCLKNGRTLGKKCFGLAVIRTNGVKLTPPVLLARSMIGRFAMETIVPLTIVFMMLLGSLGTVGIITLVLFACLQVGVMIYSKTNSCVHDLLTDSVVVDMASQQIFETQAERTDFDKAEAARKAAEKKNDGAPIATGVFAPKFSSKPITVQTANETEPAQPTASEPETAQSQNTDNA